MAASSSAVAVDPSLHKYDVFISFRGETRNSFTSHLYFALCQKHITAYIDEVSLEKGDDIERALPMAIKQSAISIIVFSKNYASSRWCLDELVHILECREEKAQIVLPIFYGIDPSHIRHQKETYAAAFVKHQERFEDKIVQEWRQALRRAADLSGWDSRFMSESVLVQQLVQHVISKLQSISSTSIDDLKGLFGIPGQLCEVESLLCFDSPNVFILGIWGMGGIGKTTLARVVFKRFSNRFEGACFLESVREESQRKGLVQLEKDVFSKLLGDKDPDVYDPLLLERRRRTKALLVLDDVNEFGQLERLAGHRNWFGPGSKIIVTSRDLQVLTKLDPNETYEVQALDQDEASQLFYLKAFEENSDRSGYEAISAEVVSFTEGNPLALQVLGSSLKSLGVKQWESALENLKGTPHVDIQKVLRISYDGLGTQQQDIFLDIACFLKNETKDFVEGILGPESIHVIDVLVKKSLIIVNQYGLIRMHDLIQEMGWEIVRQSTKKLGKPSRLWIAEDVSNVLAINEGTDAIEGIYLPWIEEEVHLRSDVFEKMRKLRLLKIYNAHQFNRDSEVKVSVDGDLKYLPNGLRYLHWEGYLGKSWPSNFKPLKLVELYMPHSNLKQLWDGVLKLGSLKHINLHDSKLLTEIPDLSLCPKLESINLSGCVSLTTLPKLPRNIKVLVLNHSGIEQIPSSSIGSKLESFPMLSDLCYLTKLDLSNCNIGEIPDWLGSLASLTELYLQRNPFGRIPASIGMLYKLKELDISKCNNLQSLPELPLFIEYVNAEGCSLLEMVSTLRSTLTLGRWLDKYHSHNYCHRREFSFVNCTKLDEDAVNNIFTEFLYKVFCTATTPPGVVVSEAQRVNRELIVCYPTNEIPRWFNNRSEGFSMTSKTIALPPNWNNPKTFLGFVVSVVVVKDEYVSEGPSSVECTLHLRTDRDRFRVNDGDYGYIVKSGLDHIVMWYNNVDHSKANVKGECTEASFEFKCRYSKVRRCGVRMLYLRDAVENSIDGKSDDHFESWIIDAIDSDSASDDHFQSCGSDFQSSGSEDDFQSCGSEDDDQSCGSDDDFQSCGSEDDDQSRES